MIKFETEESNTKEPVFGDVETDQFFIDRHGRLCQKESKAGYVVIADPDGTPFCCSGLNSADLDGTPFCCSGLNSVEWTMPIKQVLPKVTKITWKSSPIGENK